MKKVLVICFSALLCHTTFCQSTSTNGYEILTPKQSPTPHLNNHLVYGARPGNPFLFRIPCQGNRPIKFTIQGLPSSLHLDAASGIISGTVPSKGSYNMMIIAANEKG